MPTPRQPLPDRKTHQLDAAAYPLGRLATQAANFLMGKHKVTYVPQRDVGDRVTVVNASSLRLSGKKLQQKVYFRASGHGGGIRTYRASELRGSRPEVMVRHAIRHMLPNNKLRTARLNRLRVIP